VSIKQLSKKIVSKQLLKMLLRQKM